MRMHMVHCQIVGYLSCVTEQCEKMVICRVHSATGKMQICRPSVS